MRLVRRDELERAAGLGACRNHQRPRCSRDGADAADGALVQSALAAGDCCPAAQRWSRCHQGTKHLGIGLAAYIRLLHCGGANNSADLPCDLPGAPSSPVPSPDLVHRQNIPNPGEWRLSVR
jgi:hypothetical protein